MEVLAGVVGAADAGAAGAGADEGSVALTLADGAPAPMSVPTPAPGAEAEACTVELLDASVIEVVDGTFDAEVDADAEDIVRDGVVEDSDTGVLFCLFPPLPPPPALPLEDDLDSV